MSDAGKRQCVLDTETTGLSVADGHRVIEIGVVELLDRALTGAVYHVYLNPERPVDQAAIEVHGLTDDFLKDKPKFIDIKEDFLSFINGAELLIHNAAFDVSFLEHALQEAGVRQVLADLCQVTDTLALARQMFPGQKNNLDALCKRLGVGLEKRTVHGALLDAELLAHVYLRMTGGQGELFESQTAVAQAISQANPCSASQSNGLLLCSLAVADDELRQHDLILERIKSVKSA